MSRLFVELYFDEDVSELVAKLVRSRGFSVRTTLEAENTGAADVAQLAYAAQHELAIVTHNRVHFEELAKQCVANETRHSGILIAVRRRPQEIARRLLEILNHVSADEIENQVRYI